MGFQLQHTIEILERTPATLRALLGGLSDSWITADEGPDSWSPFDVVGHLILGERIDWVQRLRNIMEHGEAHRFVPFDRLAQFEENAGATLPELLDTFESLRQANLRVLQELNLGERILESKGTHPELGPVTARQLLATWAVHDLGHIAQITRVMAKSYSEEVGPWGAYLSILNR
jgi:hypothetical protein